MEDEDYYDQCGDDDVEDYDCYADEPRNEMKQATAQRNIYFPTISDFYNHIIEKGTEQILEIFSFLTQDQLIILMVAYKYDFDRLKEKLGEDVDLVLNQNRVLYEASLQPIFCQICLEKSDSHHLSCCGMICQTCLQQYLRLSIFEWKLGLSCPACEVKIHPSTLSKELFFEFRKRLVQQFLKNKQNYTECIDCHTYIEFWRAKKVIECECHCEICQGCEGFAHQPLNCETYKKWNEKVVSETRNLVWIMKNTKKCESCGWFIEKNSGCNHMTCKKCAYEFCWLCLGNWKSHTKCTTFVEKKTDSNKKINSEMDQEEDRRLQFYGMRYQNFEQGEKFAKTMKQQMPEKITTLSFLLDMNEGDFAFVYDAINTIIMTRRRVKCLYAYIFMKKFGEKEKEVLEYNLETVQTNLEELTLTIEGISNEAEFEHVTQEGLLALQRKIKEYKENIYKFTGLILGYVQNK